MLASHASLTRRGVLLATLAMFNVPTTALSLDVAPPLLHAADRYMVTPSGTPIFLCGMHEWANGQDVALASNGGQPFDEAAYLASMKAGNLNCIRLWEWLAATDGGAKPGGLNPMIWHWANGKFDLSKLNPAYFSRILARIRAAAAAGCYVIVPCVNGTSMAVKTSWQSNPFNKGMNVNGIDGDPGSTGLGLSVYEATSSPFWGYITALIDRLVATLAQETNVIWEVGNEIPDNPRTRAFQDAVVAYIKAQEQRTGALRHPVMISAPYPVAFSNVDTNTWMAHSDADLFSPAGTILDGHNDSYFFGSAPLAGGGKPCILDSDHINPGTQTWRDVWGGFTSGFAGYLLMDDLAGTHIAGRLFVKRVRNEAAERSARAAMTQVRQTASLVNLASMTPQPHLSSTGYCLADPAAGEFIVFAPDGGNVAVNLSGANGKRLQAEWLDLTTGWLSRASAVSGTSSSQAFTSPNAAGALIVRPEGATRYPSAG